MMDNTNYKLTFYTNFDEKSSCKLHNKFLLVCVLGLSTFSIKSSPSFKSSTKGPFLLICIPQKEPFFYTCWVGTDTPYSCLEYCFVKSFDPQLEKYNFSSILCPHTHQSMSRQIYMGSPHLTPSFIYLILIVNYRI